MSEVVCDPLDAPKVYYLKCTRCGHALYMHGFVRGFNYDGANVLQVSQCTCSCGCPEFIEKKAEQNKK